MRVAVDEKDKALTQRVLTVFTDEPGKEWNIEDLAFLLKEDAKKVRTAINNLRAGNPQIAPKINVLVPGTVYRYGDAVFGKSEPEAGRGVPAPEPERPKPPPLPKVEAKRPVQNTELPPEPQPEQAKVETKADESNLLLFHKVGRTKRGTIIAEGEDDQLYAIRVVDL